MLRGMRASHRWGLLLAALVLLGLGSWLKFGRGGEQPTDEQQPSKVEPQISATTAKQAQQGKQDSTAVLLQSDKATISGTVRDPQGQGIANATVCAWANQQELRGAGDQRPRCVTSEHDGHYRIAGLWPVATVISASAPEFIPARFSERVDDRRQHQLRLRAGQERSGIDLTLERGGERVRGVVKDISGGVIEGALVNASDRSWNSNDGYAIAWTDEAGQFELWAKPGDISLQAMAEGYADAETKAVVPTQLAEIFMTPESVITGVVVHAESGDPVAGASVQASAADFFARSFGMAVSDEQGRFRIAGLKPGIYDLTAVTDSLYGEADEQIHLGLGESAELIVRAHPSFALRGRIVIAETGEPCPEGSVHLVGDDTERYVSTEGEGTILMRALLPGEYSVGVRCEGYLAADDYPPIVIGDAPLEPVEWQVHAGLAIRGIVVDSGGDPIGKAGVYARPKPKPGDDPRAQLSEAVNAQTESDGNFELAGLLAGSYELHAWAQDYPQLREPVTVEIAEGKDVEDVRVVMPATGSLEGIVRDESGEPVAGATVSANLVDAWGRTQVRTGDDGRFRMERVQIGQQRVTAETAWFEQMRTPGTGDDDLQGELVEVTDGGTAQVELVVERRAGIIRGRVLDSDGGPVADAFVDAVRMSDSAAANSSWARVSMRWGWDRQPVLSDHDGSFELRELADGNYMIRAYREGGGEAVLEGVAVGSSDAVLTIAETGRVAGKVTLASGGAPDRFTVKLRDRSTGLDRSDDFFRTAGKFSLRELPPGKYEVTVSAREGSAQTEVVLESGQAVDDLVIELSNKVTVKGRLVDADTRAPIPGMRVSVQARSGMYMFGPDQPGERRNVSDAEGRFEVEDAPAGKVELVIMPRNFDYKKYMWTQRFVTLPSEPAVQDLGDIEMIAARLDTMQEKAGDLGFKTKSNEPGTEPEDAFFEVAVIRPGGPAEGSGLEVGDRILEVDGRGVSGLDSHRYRTLTRAPPGTVIELTIEGGKQVKIELGPATQ